MGETPINVGDYPHLFQESTWLWGPIRAAFELRDAPPPENLIGHVNIVPYMGDDWVTIRLEDGWDVIGGTLERGETYGEAIRRELLEEAGARLLSFTLIGAWRCRSLAPYPYRPHLPHPVFYRLLGYGEVELARPPLNPAGGERVLEVAAAPLEETCRRLLHGDNRKVNVEVYRLAAALRLKSKR